MKAQTATTGRESYRRFSGFRQHRDWTLYRHWNFRTTNGAMERRPTFFLRIVHTYLSSSLIHDFYLPSLGQFPRRLVYPHSFLFTMPVLSARDESSTMRPIYIAGFAVVGAIVLAVSIWLAIRFYRHRALKKRDNMRNAAFLSVKGLVSDDSVEKDFTTNGFSRTHLTRSVVLPDRALRTTPQEIAEFHRQSGNFPRPFAPSSKPFTFPLSPPDRSSLFSTGSGSRLSVLSTISTTSVTSIDPSSPTSTRKVRQTYTPILPDELLIAPSERLMVVQSFDDGWCVVGRPLPNKAAQPKSLFKTPFPSDVELGVVPAWCFLKHVKAERPVRSSSLGITVQMDLDGPGVKRDDLVSWSNF